MSDQAMTVADEPTCGGCEPSLSARAERGEQKCAQVLAGARAVFIASGYEGASVDDIARTAGISKATLYRHFPDKQALFIAVVEQECRRQAEHHPELCDASRPLAAVLIDLARETVKFGVSDFAQGIYRVAVAESERFQHVGESFYKSGFERNRQRLAPLLIAADARGELCVPDPDFAAHVFFSICKSDLFHRRLFSIGERPGPDAIERHARLTVETFLRAFGYQGETSPAAAEPAKA